jgi:uncharacterized protein YbjQ (UPF0145 family)
MKVCNLLPLVALIFLSLDVSARDTQSMFSIEKAMKVEAAKEKLNSGIKFYFGKQKHGRIEKRMGNVQSNKKTNAFGKSDEEACSWAFLSAMIALQDRAVRDGGNAVVNIRSYYKKHEVVSETEYECGAGNVIAGVTFTGDIVKLSE